MPTWTTPLGFPPPDLSLFLVSSFFYVYYYNNIFNFDPRQHVISAKKNLVGSFGSQFHGQVLTKL